MKWIEFGRMCLLLLSLSLASCLSTQAGEEERYHQLAIALTKLSKAVEAVVAFDDSPAAASLDDLLARATAHDRSLLTPFSEYSLQVVRQGAHAAVLVCTADGERALLEDAGCTARLDRHAWKENPLRPCRSGLDLQQACSP